MTTTTSPVAAGAPERLRGGRTAIWVALAALALKLPQLVLALVLFRDPPSWFRGEGASLSAILLSIGWLLFSIVTLAMRTYVGAVSTLWFCLVSAISGVLLMTQGYVPWGAAQTLTAVVAVVAVVVAFTQRAFKGSRW